MRGPETCHLCGKERPSYVEMEVSGVRKSLCERCYKTKVAVPRESVDSLDDGDSVDATANVASDSEEGTGVEAVDSAGGMDTEKLERMRRAFQTIPPLRIGRGKAGDARPQDALPEELPNPESGALSEDRPTNCRSCGARVGEKDAFCHSCGAKTELACGKCGRNSSAGDNFCHGCGEKL